MRSPRLFAMAIPRLLKLGEAGSEFVPFAKKKFREFERLRKRLGLPHLRKTLTIKGTSQTLVQIYSSDWDNFVLIQGGADAMIALSLPATTTDTGHLLGFDYYTKQFNDLVSDDLIGDSDLSPGYDKQLIYTDGVVSDGNNGYDVEQTGWFYQAEPVININDGKISLHAQDSQLYGVMTDNSWLVHTFSSNVLADLCGLTPQGPVIVTDPRPGNDWNKAYGVDVFTLSGLSSKDIAFTWVPNFYAIYPGNGMGMRPGWYYGQRYNSAYGATDPLNSAEVYFKGVATNRQKDPSLYKYGRFEAVGSYEVDYGDDGEQTVCDLFAYFDASPPTTYSNSTEYYQYGMTISMDIAHVTCGDGGKGDAPTFWIRLDPTQFNASSLRVDSVVIDVQQNEDAIGTSINSMFGGIFTLASDGNNAVLYRYSGYLTKIYETSRYMAHSFSNDGTTLAIFEGAGVIDNVVVYDLYGKRQKLQDAQDADEWVEPSYAAGDEYSGPGTTQLCNTHVPEQYQGSYAAIIPHSNEEVETELAEPPATIVDQVSDSRDSLPSGAIIKFSTDGQGGFFSEKITIESGVKASLASGGDDCMTNTVIVEEGTTEQTHLVATTDRLGPHNGKFRIRGRFDDGQLGPLKMKGEGAPKYSITMPDSFAWYFTTGSARLYVPRYSGELVPGDCTSIDEYGSVVFDRESGNCCPDGNGDVTVEVRTSCGQSSTRKHSVADIYINSTVAYNDPVDIGDSFSTGSGLPPYSWSSSGFSISVEGDNNERAVVTAINDCEPDEIFTGTITATDSCGESITKTYRLTGGSWVSLGSEFFYSTPYYPSSVIEDEANCNGYNLSAADFGWTVGSYNRVATRITYSGEYMYSEAAYWLWKRSVDLNQPERCDSDVWIENTLSQCGYLDTIVDWTSWVNEFSCCRPVEAALCVSSRQVYVWVCP